MAVKLLDTDRENVLRELAKSNWNYLVERDAIMKKFEFANFIDEFISGD